MRKTPYARRMDQTGRVIIPVKLRNEVGLKTGELVEFFVTKDEDGKAWLCIPFGDNKNEIQTLLED